MIFGLKIAKKFGFKRTCLASMFLFSGFIFLSSFSPNFTIFFLLYGIIPGLCIGIAFRLPVYCGKIYFPNQKFKISGYINCAFGLSSSIFTIIATYIINPYNQSADLKDVVADNCVYLYFDTDVSNKVPQLIRILSIIYAVVGCLGALMVTHHNEEKFGLINID